MRPSARQLHAMAPLVACRAVRLRWQTTRDLMSAQAASDLVYAPGRDGALTARVLSEAGFACTRIDSDEQLLSRVHEDPGALLMAEEVITERLASVIGQFVRDQPAWSDLPLLVVAQSQHAPRFSAYARLGNVSILT